MSIANGNLFDPYRRVKLGFDFGTCSGTFLGTLLVEGAMSRKGLTPGSKAPKSGQYQQIGPRGRKGPEVTSVKGEPLPPTTQKGSTYKLVDPTKNKSGMG